MRNITTEQSIAKKRESEEEGFDCRATTTDQPNDQRGVRESRKESDLKESRGRIWRRNPNDKQSKMVSTGMKCIKYVLFVFNLIFYVSIILSANASHVRV